MSIESEGIRLVIDRLRDDEPIDFAERLSMTSLLQHALSLDAERLDRTDTEGVA